MTERTSRGGQIRLSNYYVVIEGLLNVETCGSHNQMLVMALLIITHRCSRLPSWIEHTKHNAMQTHNRNVFM